MRRIMLAILCLFLLPAAALAETHHVSPEGLSLTEALARAKDGDVIELADGLYTQPRESFPLVVDKAVTLRAAQGAKPVIEGPAMVSAVKVEAEDVTIEGLAVNFRRHGLYVTGSGLNLRDCDVTLIDAEHWRTSSCGIWFGGVENIVMQDVRFTECSPCFAGPPISERSVGFPVLTGMFEVGEDVRYFTTHTIENCTVNGKPLFYAVSLEEAIAPADAGAVIIADCDRAVVRGVNASNASMGVELVSCRQVEVSDCRADDCGIFGVYVAKAQGGSITGCTVARTNHGIDIRASQAIVTSHCTATDCDQGIFYSMVQRGLVQECVVSGTGQGYFFAAGTDNHLDRCAATECENGFNMEHENGLLITGCTLTGNTICALRLNGSDTILTACRFSGNWVDVMAYAGAALVMTDSTLMDSGACGLMLRDVAYSRISGNTITSAGNAVEVRGTLNATLLTGNAFSSPIRETGVTTLVDLGNTIIP